MSACPFHRFPRTAMSAVLMALFLGPPALAGYLSVDAVDVAPAATGCRG